MALITKKQLVTGDEAADLERAQKPRRHSYGKAPKRSGKRFVLIVGDEGGILVFMQGAKVLRRLFAPSPQIAHTEAMLELMRANAGVPVSILVDMLDQQYVRQSFPPVSSLSVGGLVRRRLERDFNAEDLKGSLALGRDKTGRKEWNYLLVSLAKTPLLTEWLDHVIELPNELKGIYLVPVEAPSYFSMLSKAVHNKAPLAWQLLVSHNKVSGFRQVVMRGGKIVFTRVTQAIDDAIPAVIAGNIEQEIINTLEYLRRLDFQDNGSLEAMLIVSQEVHDALDLNRFTLGRANMLTPLDVADALGFEQAALSADCYGDVVMAAAFASTRIRNLRLMTVYGEKLAKLYMAGMAIKVVAGLTAVALLGLSAVNAYEMMQSRSAAADTKAKTMALQPQQADLQKSIDALSKDLTFKSAIVDTYDAYVKHNDLPDDFATQIAPLLSPEHRMTSMEWKYRNDAGENAPPLEIKASFQFNGAYPDQESQVKATTDFLAQLKQQLPQYDITADPIPGLTGGKQNIEVSFGQQVQQAINAIKEGPADLKVKFVGPKKSGVASAPEPTGDAE